MNGTYTFIAYKSNSDDYCMSCHMASYDSHFVHERVDTCKELVALLAECLYKDATLDTGESGYGGDIIIYQDGVLLYCMQDGYSRGEDEMTPEQSEVIVNVFKEAKELVDKRLEIDKKLAAEKLRNSLEAAEQEKRAQYERLKAEFEAK